MTLSRRKLLRHLGTGATIATALSSLSELTLADTVEGSPAPGGPLFLDRNENAYGASPKARAAAQASVESLSRFPHTEPISLVEELAALHKTKTEQVLIGCGSTEIMRMAATAFLSKAKKLVLASPTFTALARYADSCSAEAVAVPLTKRYSHDLTAMLAHADATAGLIYICNPNNPTGSLTPRKDLDDFLQKLPPSVTIIVDEAYHHYAGGSSSYESFLARPIELPNVVVTRTFSKIYGLAGLRVGYAVSSQAMIKRLSLYGASDSVSVIAAKAAVGALDDGSYVRDCALRNTDDRQEFFNQVNARMLRGIDSLTNFILLDAARPVPPILEHFRKNNIMLAPPISSMPQYIRVSLGRPVEMEKFWRVWDLMPAHPMAM